MRWMSSRASSMAGAVRASSAISCAVRRWLRGPGPVTRSRMDETLFSVGGTPASDREIGELESALREEIERLKDGAIDAEELERVKTNVRADDVFQRDSMFYQAMRMGMLEMVGVGQDAWDAYQQGVQRVTAEDVHRVAREYLTDQRLTVAELVPEGVDGSARPAAGDEGPIGGEDAVAQ